MASIEDKPMTNDKMDDDLRYDDASAQLLLTIIISALSTLPTKFNLGQGSSRRQQSRTKGCLGDIRRQTARLG